MKRAIFVCDRVDQIDRVYSPAVKHAIAERVELDPAIYTKQTILDQPQVAAEVDFLFSTWGMPAFTEEEIQALFPRLACVFYAAGTVQQFARPFLNCGVKVFSAWAANGIPVAEYTVSQILLANKGFFVQTRLMAQKDLAAAKERKATCIGNYGERIGLIGCGMIGSLVARMLGSYDLEVLVYDPYLSESRAAELGVRKTSLEELFAFCRVVSNHLPNLESTKAMLTYKHFASMLPFATFLNTGRGAQVVEEDLVRALSERADLTAVLDVTYPEPAAPEHPFYTLPNCFMTPHIAGSLGNEVVRMARYMLQELERCLTGAPCLYEVSMKMLETMA